MLVIIMSFWLAMGGVALAQSGGIAEARLISKSTSGKTALFNVGDLEKIKVGDHGVIMRRLKEQDANALRMIPIAKGRVVKTGPTRSLWYLYEISDPVSLIMREKYVVTTEGLMLSGRRLLENDRLRVVDEKKNLPLALPERKSGDKDLLALRKAEYELYRKQHKIGEDWDKDGVLYDVDEWVTVDREGKQKYARALWRSPHEDDFAIKKRLETFEKVVVNYLRRINDPAFNYGDFYWEQNKDAGGEFRVKSTSLSIADEMREEEKKANEEEIVAHRKIIEKGQGWSDDYSDEQLQTMLNKVGVSYEQDRRRNATYKSYDVQFSGGLGLNALDNENRADAENARKAKWSLEGGVEWFPVPRGETLRQLALFSTLRYVIDGVSVGNLNAQTEEYSFGVGGTWHLLHSPFTIGRNIPFLSLGVRSGIARLTIPSVGEKGNYSVVAFPQVAGGVKYNLRTGMGFRAALSFEKLMLEQTSANRPGGNLPARSEILDGRLSFGLTKFY
jgi:hypothetical protein